MRRPARKPIRPRLACAAVAAVALGVAVPVAAWGAVWQDGDVFVGLNTGQYNIYTNGGTLQETIDQGTAGPAVNCAFDRSGVLHTTAFNFSKLVRFTGPHPHTALADVPTGPGPQSVSFARDGSYYVGHEANPDSLRKFTGAGSPGPTFSPTNPASLLDLSADQKTMFYTSRSGAARTQIHRFDVRIGANLPDFANLGGTELIGDLRLLPPGDGSGGAIVAQTASIKRVNGSGRTVQTYDVPGEDAWFGIALDPDGRSFWAQTGTPGNVYRLSIASGAVDRGPLASAANAFGICVKGTRTAALDNAPPSISISTPADGANFTLGESVAASYTCTDDPHGTRVKSCSGPVPSGADIDTGSLGTKTFRVDASDNAGNTARRTHSYNVVARPTPQRFERILVTVSFNFRRPTRRATKLTQFRLKEVPRRSRVRVTCRPRKKGSACPAKAFTKSNARGTVNVKRFRRKFRAGTVIEARVTKPNMIGAVKLVKIRRSRDPSITTRCLPPGATRPKKC